MEYLNSDLLPIFSNCYERNGDLSASLFIFLVIDKQGNVIDATFGISKISDQCRTDLKKKLLTMKGWTPGQLHGKNVCTRFNWPINCIKWNLDDKSSPLK